jgi:hypothetical protein
METRYIQIVLVNSKEPIFANLVAGSVHAVLPVPEYAKSTHPESIWVMGFSRPVCILPDEFINYEGPINAEILNIFEKSQQDSKKLLYLSQETNVKNKSMKNVEKVSAEISNLTKTEMGVMEAIFSNPLKGKAFKSDNAKMIAVVADLSVVDANIDGIDAAKVCRKLHRAGLITYAWNEDKSRSVAITQEGFDIIQLGVKVPKEKVAKEPKEKVAKEPKEKVSKEPKAKVSKSKLEDDAPVDVDNMSEGQMDDHLLGVPKGFEVKANPVAKVFNVTFPDSKKYRLKVATAQEFKDVKSNSYQEWEDLRELGELTSAE